MKINTLLAALLLSVTGAASAHNVGVQGSAGIGGNITVYQGSVSGNAGASSTGSAITSTLINGNGSSVQRQANQTGATAQVGGTINAGGVKVSTGTTEFSNSQGSGHLTGGNPVSQDGSIVNGGTAFGDGEGVAGVTSSFAKGSIGGSVAIKGFAQIGAIH